MDKCCGTCKYWENHKPDDERFKGECMADDPPGLPFWAVEIMMREAYTTKQQGADCKAYEAQP